VITGSSELEEAEAVASFLEDSNGVLDGSRRVPCAGAVPATEYSYWGVFGAWVTPRWSGTALISHPVV